MGGLFSRPKIKTKIPGQKGLDLIPLVYPWKAHRAAAAAALYRPFFFKTQGGLFFYYDLVHTFYFAPADTWSRWCGRTNSNYARSNELEPRFSFKFTCVYRLLD